MTLGLLIFAATYLLIAIQRLPFVHLNRPAASLLGAVAMVVLGVLPLRDAYAAIDFDVLVFLLGLMLIVGYLEVGKFFERSEEHTSELQSQSNLVCRLLLEKKHKPRESYAVLPHDTSRALPTTPATRARLHV